MQTDVQKENWWNTVLQMQMSYSGAEAKYLFLNNKKKVLGILAGRFLDQVCHKE